MPVQVLEDQDLVRDKATAIKVVIVKTGNTLVEDLAIQVDVDGKISDSFYVLDSNDTSVLYGPQSLTNLSASTATKTIYFINNDIIPSNSSYTYTVTIDPNDTIEELTNENNNLEPEEVSVVDTSWGFFNPDKLIVGYFPTDWEDSDFSLYHDYFISSSDYLLGVLPIANSNFSTQKLDTSGDTSLLRPSGSRMGKYDLCLWIWGKYASVKLSNLTIERFVAVVPPGWFSKNTDMNYVGMWCSGAREMVVFEALPHTSGAAMSSHELGHSFNLHHDCQGCDTSCSVPPAKISRCADDGFWVDESRPMLISPSRQIFRFMDGHKSGVEYWPSEEDYQNLLTYSKAEPASLLTLSPDPSRGILAIGNVKSDKIASLEDWFILPGLEYDRGQESGTHSFEYRNRNGDLLYTCEFSPFITSGDSSLEEGPVALTLPYVENTVSIKLVTNGITLAEKSISTHSPYVELIQPGRSKTFSSKVPISWKGTDEDGDELSYVLLYSSDNGMTWQTISFGVTENEYLWETPKSLACSTCKIRVIATDGINTGQDTSDSPFSISRPLFIPIISR